MRDAGNSLLARKEVAVRRLKGVKFRIGHPLYTGRCVVSVCFKKYDRMLVSIIGRIHI